jgi:hypothetical protein
MKLERKPAKKKQKMISKEVIYCLNYVITKFFAFVVIIFL